MPVTPKFQLEQDEEFIVVSVHVPYVRIGDLEYNIDGSVLSFYVKPYLLRLNFPHELQDDDRARAVYDPNDRNGTIKIHLPKKTKGQHFEDLDLLTKLKQPKRSSQAAARPLIQVVDSKEFAPSEGESEEAAQVAPSEYLYCLKMYANLEKKRVIMKQQQQRSYSTALLEMEQLIAGKAQEEEVVLPSEGEAEEEVIKQVSMPRYGFNNRFENFFKDIKLEDPDETPAADRRRLRLAAEDKDFSEERFVADLFSAQEDWLFGTFMDSEPFWLDSAKAGSLTEAEQEQLMALDNVDLLPLVGEERLAALCQIYDLLLANAYDWRMTQGESNVESAWTIRTLSASLSWLEQWSGPAQVLESAIHRTLTYPYIRHTDLTRKIVEDASQILENGKRAVLKCLLRIRDIFAHSDTFYLFNRLFINDLALWIQLLPDQEIEDFRDKVITATSAMAIDDAIRWDIPAIVQRALEGLEEEEEGE